MAGFIFSSGGTFGVSNGPTYQGHNQVLCNVLGTENYRDYPALALNAVITTIDALGFTLANFLALGFTVANSPVQTGAPTPAELLAATCTIRLVGIVAGPLDFSITLIQGQFAVFLVPDATWALDCTAIEVDGDAAVDMNVNGLLALTA